MPGFPRVVAQAGSITGTSVTATTAATATTVVTLDSHKRALVVESTCDKDCWMTADAVDFLFVPAGSAIAIDLEPWRLQLNKSQVMGARNDGSAPTSGKLVFHFYGSAYQ